MKPIEIVELIKKDNPKLFTRVMDKDAASLILKSFVSIRNELNAMNDGVLTIAGLGKFRIQQIEREKEGEKLKIKRTTFQVAKPKIQD